MKQVRGSGDRRRKEMNAREQGGDVAEVVAVTTRGRGEVSRDTLQTTHKQERK